MHFAVDAHDVGARVGTRVRAEDETFVELDSEAVGHIASITTPLASSLLTGARNPRVATRDLSDVAVREHDTLETHEVAAAARG